jgi:hypothetical protein
MPTIMMAERACDWRCSLRNQELRQAILPGWVGFPDVEMLANLTEFRAAFRARSYGAANRPDESMAEDGDK